MTAGDDAAPGRSAIDGALSDFYGDTEPACHWGTVKRRWRSGAREPLDGISVYRRSEPVAHWHYVSYGLSELYAKESEFPKVSGWGFELTARLRRRDETTPPVFMADLLQDLARYVCDTGNVLASGHSMDLFSPIQEGSDSNIRAALFYDDPELSDFFGPFGHVRFLQVVGVTEDERAAIRTWDQDAVKPVLSKHLPLLVTDLDRRSLLQDPEFDRAIVEGRNRDGSSLATLRISTLAVQPGSWLSRRPALITLPATVVDSLCLALPLRIPYGRPFQLTSTTATLRLVPGPAHTLTQSISGWTLTVTHQQAEAISATLRPVAGTYVAPGLAQVVFQVERTAIRDHDGNITGYLG
ncbi:MAG: suppressor of fused domain protein [Mycobacteriales bacterium]